MSPSARQSTELSGSLRMPPSSSLGLSHDSEGEKKNCLFIYSLLIYHSVPDLQRCGGSRDLLDYRDCNVRM